MDFQKSFSKLKEKVKHRLAGKKRKPGGTGADAVGERADPAGPLPRPEPHVVAGGGSAVRPPQPDEPGPVLVCGDEGDQEGGEVDVDGREVSRRHSPLHPDVGVAARSEPNREGNDADGEKVGQVHPSPSTTPIPHIVKPDSTYTRSFFGRCP